MGRRNHCRGKDLKKAGGLVKGAGNEKDKKDFDKLGWLERDPGNGIRKLASVGGLSQNHYH